MTKVNLRTYAIRNKVNGKYYHLYGRPLDFPFLSKDELIRTLRWPPYDLKKMDINDMEVIIFDVTDGVSAPAKVARRILVKELPVTVYPYGKVNNPYNDYY